MSISEKDKDAILRLRTEGKTCSKIWSDDYPQLDYWDIMGVIYDDGSRTALGTKRAIANRCKKIGQIDNQGQRMEIAKEIDNLARQLYQMILDNQKRFEEVRKITSRQKMK